MTLLTLPWLLSFLIISACVLVAVMAIVSYANNGGRENLVRLGHWIIAISLAMGILGAIIQLIRFGAIIEPSGIGPDGF